MLPQFPPQFRQPGQFRAGDTIPVFTGIEYGVPGSRRRVEAEEASRAISSLVEREADRRVAIWLRVHVGGERMTKVAAQYGYKDGSGVHQVVKRLEARAKRDPALSARLTALADPVSSVKS